MPLMKRHKSTHRRQAIAAFMFVLIHVFFTGPTLAQKKGRFSNISLRDSLDGKMDFSDFLIDAHGFIPVPIIITEPALGGFGGGIAPVFLQKNPPIIRDGVRTPQPPNLTTGLIGATVNGSWFTGAFRAATIRKWGIRYKTGLAYADINISYYRNIANLGEKEFAFNLKTVPIYLNVNKQLYNPKWSLGLQYIFAHTNVSLRGTDSLPDFVKDREVKSNIGELGVVGFYDSRDNTFTPDKGIKAQALVNFSDNVFGSDYDYQRLNSYIYWFQPIRKNETTGKGWISGLRFDYQQMFGNPPFYIIPSIQLRGVPTMRYQGMKNMLAETEQRWDIVRRWSLITFAGAGKAFDDYSEFGDAQWIYSYGAGFRYLLARKFKLRMGVDVAKGPSDWGYYIVFGSFWVR
ncbi:hypothetical protein [Flavihumibacter petaseus]|uniref:Bacterial surface antigen (D15) domain-containing protein n=1 Tax=Flavihumibacter petaseus NBRC 106054 TaxID=1220578 RepID=A0A0E9MUE6_9BACT|nr:hypothetical protein [Flavihumibacter petaseus]GAO41108.1 hypothetical protein FPE01S_01_01200 [Flavihumibacter petaseus NBRC 106054]